MLYKYKEQLRNVIGQKYCPRSGIGKNGVNEIMACSGFG
jgi:hypothetical protein